MRSASLEDGKVEAGSKPRMVCICRRLRSCGAASCRALVSIELFDSIVSVRCEAQTAHPSSSTATSQVAQDGDVTDLAPSAIHWALAAILVVALIGSLVRVARILQNDDAITPIRHAPEGMRPVQCGACHSMQHVTIHGRIFICFSCHSANRIAMDFSISEDHHLVAATGPLRRFEFHREGENFFQETTRVEIDDAEAARLIAAAAKAPVTGNATGNANNPEVPVNTQASNEQPSCETLPEEPTSNGPTPPDESNADVDEQDTQNGVNPRIGTRPTPAFLGRASSDLESNPSITSKPSKMSCAGLPSCVVCLEDEGNMVLLPCAHGGVCEGCATRIAQNRASGGAHCPHCRGSIQTLVKLHEVDGRVAKGVEFRIPIARVI